VGRNADNKGVSNTPPNPPPDSEIVEAIRQSLAEGGDIHAAIEAGGGESGGGGAPGASIVRKFPFAFDSPGILTGFDVYTPTIGDVLLDAWIEIDTAWDGTTPLFDFGDFTGGPASTDEGWFGQGTVGALSLGFADGSFLSSLLLGQENNGTTDSDFQQASVAAMGQFSGNSRWRSLPAKFIVADPIKVCVSQDGTTTGADPGSTVGAGALYLVTATPGGGGASPTVIEMDAVVYANNGLSSSAVVGVVDGAGRSGASVVTVPPALVVASGQVCTVPVVSFSGGSPDRDYGIHLNLLVLNADTSEALVLAVSRDLPVSSGSGLVDWLTATALNAGSDLSWTADPFGPNQSVHVTSAAGGTYSVVLQFGLVAVR
jgi:hypothetical protein